jgi:hypothetical protein
MPLANVSQSDKDIDQDENIDHNDHNQADLIQRFVVDGAGSTKKLT